MSQVAAVEDSDPIGSTADPERTARRRGSAYRTVWRWHLYAGLLTAPVLLTAAVTGGIYVFIDELKPILYPHLFCSKSPAPASSASLQSFVVAARREHPQAVVASVVEPRSPGLNAEVTLKIGDRHLSTFVDPADGRVTEIYDEHDSFFGIVLAIHRRLFAGSVGRMLVELAASWGVILLITGTYLWWPRAVSRTQSPGAGVWFPRLRMSFNVALRDLHAVLGVYSLGTAAFILVTGLFFTQLFGPGYNWLSKNLGGVPETVARPPQSKVVEGRPRLTADEAVRLADPQLPGYGPCRVQLPEKPTDPYRVTRADWSNPTWKSTVLLDAYTGEFLGMSGWAEAGGWQMVRMSVYPIHVGSIFGLTTKVLALLTCVALFIMCITGAWMWWRKRPRGTWGIPSRSTDERVPGAWIALIVALGVLLPAMGASLVIVLVGDGLYRRFAFQFSA